MRDYLEELLRGLPLPEEKEGTGPDWTLPTPLQPGWTPEARNAQADGGTEPGMERPWGRETVPPGPYGQEDPGEEKTTGQRPVPAAGGAWEDRWERGDPELQSRKPLAPGGEDPVETGGSAALKESLDRVRMGMAVPGSGAERTASASGTEEDVETSPVRESGGEMPGGPNRGGVQSLEAEWRVWARAVRAAAALPSATGRHWGSPEAPAERSFWYAPAGRERNTPEQDARAVDRAFRRDARRYDGAFPLY